MSQTVVATGDFLVYDSRYKNQLEEAYTISQDMTKIIKVNPFKKIADNNNDNFPVLTYGSYKYNQYLKIKSSTKLDQNGCIIEAIPGKLAFIFLSEIHGDKGYTSEENYNYLACYYYI